MAMASGLAMMPNEVFVEADGVSCGTMAKTSKVHKNSDYFALQLAIQWMQTDLWS